MKDKHTPLPWFIEDGELMGTSERDGIVSLLLPVGPLEHRKTDLEFACWAVNNHEKLVEACIEARETIQVFIEDHVEDEDMDSEILTFEMLKQVLAAAKGES